MINVIGLGYIGLPTALMLVQAGHTVVGTDIDPLLIHSLNETTLRLGEAGMQDLFDQARAAGFVFTTAYTPAEYYIVTVPTPYDKASKKIDPQFVTAAVTRILGICPQDAVIVIESTISPGTIDKAVRPLLVTAGREDVRLAHAPERILPGNMLHELRHNNRTIGTDDEKTAAELKELYASFCAGEIVLTDIRTAEMTKVVENTYRDINIAFANELAKICHADGLDVHEIIRIANLHPRVNILQPGPGVGGHCISVDPWFLVGDYPALTNLILSARQVNDAMPDFVLQRIHDILQREQIADLSRVGLYGLTYKENVDDVRESPTLQLLHCIGQPQNGGIQVYDPLLAADLVPNQHHDLQTFLDSVDLVVIMVAHRQLLEQMSLLEKKLILDTRHVCTLPQAEHL